MQRTDDNFQLAVERHVQGDINSAKKLYQKCLTDQKQLHIVLTNLAGICILDGELAKAKYLLDTALFIAPSYPEALSNLGRFFEKIDDLQEAEDAYIKALHLNPCLIPSLTNLVNLYVKSGSFELALQCIQKALKARPHDIKIISIKSDVLVAQHGFQRALSFLESYLPQLSTVDSLPYWSKIASLYLRQPFSDYLIPLSYLEKSISFSPKPLIDDYVNKGECLRRLSRYSECLSWSNESLSLFPNSPQLINLKALTLSDLGNYDDAEKLYQLGLRHSPTDLQLKVNLAFLYLNQGRYLHSVSLFLECLAQDSSSVTACRGLGQAYFHLSKPISSVHYYKKAISLQPSNPVLWDNILYSVCFTNSLSESSLLSLYEDYEKSYVSKLPELSSLPFSHEYSDPSDRPLKIGIISAEIGSHCVSYFLLSFVKSARSLPVEFYIFPSVTRESDPRWSEFVQLATVFEPISNTSDADACSLIRGFNLDVLLETSQHMTGNRLALVSQRLAPVQAHYIGMHGSTGVRNIDYFIGDDVITPDSFQSLFTEKLLRLNRTWVCFTPPSQYPRLRITTDSSLSVRFGSFNNIAKVSRSTARLWAAVLRAVPNSTLSIKDSMRKGDHSHHSSIIDYMVKLGIERERLIPLERRDDWFDHMDLYNDIDVALDTTPLTSGTTAFDSLFMGCVLLSHSSPWIGGRLSSSILTGLGRPDWIAPDEDGFVSLAINVSSNIDTHRSNRAAYRQSFLSSPLCDSHDLSVQLLSVLKSAYTEQAIRHGS